MTQEALKLALEALDACHIYGDIECVMTPDRAIYLHPAITALLEALAQTQEPVAWFRYQQGSRVYYDSKKWDDCQPLYTYPPQRTWANLTVDELIDLEHKHLRHEDLARAIEAKLKEKST